MEDLNLLSDETLVSLFAKGENSAFDELLQRHQNRIFSYILNIVKDKELADDLFQETFVKAIVEIVAHLKHFAGVVRQRGHRHPQPQRTQRRNH